MRPFAGLADDHPFQPPLSSPPSLRLIPFSSANPLLISYVIALFFYVFASFSPIFIFRMFPPLQPACSPAHCPRSQVDKFHGNEYVTRVTRTPLHLIRTVTHSKTRDKRVWASLSVQHLSCRLHSRPCNNVLPYYDPCASGTRGHAPRDGMIVYRSAWQVSPPPHACLLEQTHNQRDERRK